MLVKEATANLYDPKPDGGEKNIQKYPLDMIGLLKNKYREMFRGKLSIKSNISTNQ